MDSLQSDSARSDAADSAAELRRLQQRAYGPNADIDEDPAAVRRLAALQSAGPREASDDGPSAESHPDERSELQRQVDQTSESLTDDGVSSVGPHETPPRRRRWIPALWIGSIVATAVVVAAASGMWASRIAPAASGAREIAVLHPQSGHHLDGLSETADFGLGTMRTFGDFHGLTLVAPVASAVGSVSRECLYVFQTEDYKPATQTIEGGIAMGCAAGSFRANVALAAKNLPESVAKILPDDAALQFVLDGDEVHVYSDR